MLTLRLSIQNTAQKRGSSVGILNPEESDFLIWYDANDSTTIWQDYEGGSNATLAGQPIVFVENISSI